MAQRQFTDTPQDQDERLNPAGTARDLYRQETDAAESQQDAGDDTQSTTDAQEAEQNPYNPMNSTYGGAKSTKGRLWSKANLKSVAKKRGVLGIIVALVLGGGVLGAGILGPFGMLIDLAERITLKNDTTSTAMERRVLKAVGHMTGEPDEICANTTKNLKCRMGRISNSALHKLQKKGVTAVGYDGKRTGYPATKPTAYTFELDDGSKQTVQSKDLRTFLSKKENSRYANKVLGRAGAFNVRTQAWAGKYITGKFYRPFGISLDGGLADGKNTKLSAAERLKTTTEKLRKKIPGAEKISNVADTVKQKVNEHTNKAQRGGTVYLVSVAGCIATKAPMYVTAGVAAVQLAQLMPFVSETILSPGHKAKASGVDTKNAISGEDMDAVGTLLTNKSPRASDGKMSSALDSPYLLSAMGANTSKVGPSEKFTPGFSALQLLAPAMAIEKESRATCNVIMSPAAMWTAMTVDAAVTTAAATTVIGGIVKVIAGIGISFFVDYALQKTAAAASEAVITELAETDHYAKAHGEELGDVIGLSAMAFFSAGGMAHHLPALSESQLVAHQEVRANSLAFLRDLDIAEAKEHPLDTTNRYTIPGGIIASINTSRILSGSNSPLTLLASAITSPLAQPLGSPAVSAATTSDCSYAATFGLETDKPATTPAINAVGLPCTGLTSPQASIATLTALQLLQNEGWIDMNKEVDDLPDNATIDDLVSKGIIKKDTPLYEYIVSCSDAATGNYIVDIPGCVLRSGEGEADADKNRSCGTTSQGETLCTDDIVSEGDDGAQSAIDMDIKDMRSFDAIPAFLLDYQITQSVNGEDVTTEADQAPKTDDTPEESDGPQQPSGKWVSPVPSGTPYLDTGSYGSWRGQYRHEGADFAYRGDFQSICDGTVIRIDNKGDVNAFGDPRRSNQMTVDCGGSLYARYHHYYYRDLKSGIKVGAKVTAGQALAKVGNQGNSTGYHLHFEIRTKDNLGFQYTKNPKTFLKSKGVSF